MAKRSTSWQSIGKWYHESVGEQGHYYHQTVIIPNLIKLLDFSPSQPESLLDLACGQGVLSRHIPLNISYVGVDIAPSLLKAARHFPHPPSHQFIQSDITKPLTLSFPPFSHATLILALQNIEDPVAVFKNAHVHLKSDGIFIMVINHPCFRIPRQSSWGIDTERKIQYRRIDRYLSEMKIPIQTHPSKGSTSSETWSFHHPLTSYSHWLKETGFLIELIEEWCSPKASEGAAAKMENRSRQEIPLFMAIVARKR